MSGAVLVSRMYDRISICAASAASEGAGIGRRPFPMRPCQHQTGASAGRPALWGRYIRGTAHPISRGPSSAPRSTASAPGGNVAVDMEFVT